MDLENVLAELREERDAIDAAICNLKRLEYEAPRPYLVPTRLDQEPH